MTAYWKAYDECFGEVTDVADTHSYKVKHVTNPHVSLKSLILKHNIQLQPARDNDTTGPRVHGVLYRFLTSETKIQ